MTIGKLHLRRSQLRKDLIGVTDKVLRAYVTGRIDELNDRIAEESKAIYTRKEIRKAERERF